MEAVSRGGFGREGFLVRPVPSGKAWGEAACTPPPGEESTFIPSSSHWPGLAGEWWGRRKRGVYLSCATLEEAEGQGSQEGWCEGLYTSSAVSWAS